MCGLRGHGEVTKLASIGVLGGRRSGFNSLRSNLEVWGLHLIPWFERIKPQVLDR